MMGPCCLSASRPLSRHHWMPHSTHAATIARGGATGRPRAARGGERDRQRRARARASGSPLPPRGSQACPDPRPRCGPPPVWRRARGVGCHPAPRKKQKKDCVYASAFKLNHGRVKMSRIFLDVPCVLMAYPNGNFTVWNLGAPRWAAVPLAPARIRTARPVGSGRARRRESALVCVPRVLCGAGGQARGRVRTWCRWVARCRRHCARASAPRGGILGWPQSWQGGSRAQVPARPRAIAAARLRLARSARKRVPRGVRSR